jgi:hypothetical protein
MAPVTPLLFSLLLAAQDVEAKKEKIGDILRFLVEEKKAGRRYPALDVEMKRLVEEVAGPDPGKQAALIDDLLAKYAPEESPRVKIASNERWATATLMSINTAQAMFRAADLDGDGRPNYWVGDVSALHRLGGSRISAETARADARPCLPLDREGAPPMAPLLRLARAGPPAPSQGYYYVALRSYDVPGEDPKPYDPGDGRNPARYAVCAYPAEHGKTGTLTFIRSEAKMWKKDTEGKPPESFPADPVKAGWTAVD